ncbi:MAG: RNB domain-containing ribonuclease [Parachlamydiaceae bacterium]|nr:RNB domain-containing ribonuclease [Parachlamydiaceae bacterium]
MKIIQLISQLADQLMTEKGFVPYFPNEVIQQLSEIIVPAKLQPEDKDLRSLLWSSIDNDDSRDLDQLTYAEKGIDSNTTIWVAIADVDALVKKNTPIDIHAQINTTSVYTPTKIFSMLPEKLSTNLTSLNENEDRCAIIVQMDINDSGEIIKASIFPAMVKNHAKLTYSSIGNWLEGKSDIPTKVKQINGLKEILNLQHEIAQLLKRKRHEAGSLTLDSANVEIRISPQENIQIQSPDHNFAHQLIEEFMIAANQTVANHFNRTKTPSLRRIVRIPKDWDRIVEVAMTYGEKLPKEPNAKALDNFLIERKKIDPISFPDLSLTIIKLLGRGEYVVQNDPQKEIGHFALALPAYTQSTAPNRRFPDLISQRQYKALLKHAEAAYSLDELYLLASHCTQQEDGAMKIERRLNKSAAAALLTSEIGKTYKGIITGANDKGTWVRIIQPPIEGKIVKGYKGLKVGDKVTVRLKQVDVPNGFIDFVVETKKY